MSNAIRPQPGVLDIALYEGGKANVAGVANAVKLSSNENSFGPSDTAKDAFQRSMLRCTAIPIPITPSCATPLARCMIWIPLWEQDQRSRPPRGF